MKDIKSRVDDGASAIQADALGGRGDAHVPAMLQEAVRLHQSGQLLPAQAIYQDVLKLRPQHFDALHLSGIIAAQTNNHMLAVDLIGQALKVNPNNAAAYFNYGVALAELKQHQAAIDSYGRAISLKADYADAYLRRGNIRRGLGHFAAAIEDYDRAIAIKHTSADTHFCRGLALQSLQQYEEALASFDRAIALSGPNAEIQCCRGLVLRELKKFQAALDAYDQALELKPDYAEVYSNRGIVLADVMQPQAALDSYDKALQLKPHLVEAHINRGAVLAAVKRFAQAIESYDRALQIQPHNAGAYSNRGGALFEMRQYAAAIASYDKAIQIAPDHPDAYSNRGVVLRDLREFTAALADFDRAIAIDPHHANAHGGRGNVLVDLKQLQAAVESYDRALAAQPDYPFLHGTRLHAKMQICDWTNIDGDIAALVEKIGRGEKVAPSFPVLALTDSLSVQRQAAAIWVREKCPPNEELGPVPKVVRRDKIRVGYYSADFYNHATAYLMAGLFECHDRARFEFYGFSFGPDLEGDMRPRIAAAFHKFIDVRAHSDSEVAQLSRSMGIDIAVDLKGFTQDERVGIFSLRAAPVQVSYIGYPGTMAASYIDYIIGDQVVIPERHREYYAEKVVYLPGSYQVNDDKRKIGEKIFSRTELGLPEAGFIFCCFNNSYKITPAIFDIWMRILKRVPGSVLWLFEDNPAAAMNLRKAAQSRAVDPARLVFASRMSAAEHLARHRAADLFLDTLPYNAHTTASDALWMGVPVLTCPGEAFAARVAASLLTAIDMPELITASLIDYEALAIKLATEPAYFDAIKQKLARHRTTTLLFDTKKFARHIESAYTQMYERYHVGLPPDHIRVGA